MRLQAFWRYALFKTTEPKRRHWAEISEVLADMLEKCIEQSLEHHLPIFEPVLHVLASLDPIQAQRNKVEEARQLEKNVVNLRKPTANDRSRNCFKRTERPGFRGEGFVPFHDIEYSYDRDNFHPLGLRLFQMRVRTPESSRRRTVPSGFDA